MEQITRKELLKSGASFFSNMEQTLAGLGTVRLDTLPASCTALAVIDVINGFVREGALQSGRVEAIIPAIAGLIGRCGKLGIPVVAFADSHSQGSREFASFPPHCLQGGSETEMVKELKSAGPYRLFPKNSTNGFLEEAFQRWLGENSGIRTFIVTGDCTDLCVLQFAVTLKTWFNRLDRTSEILLPVNAVETFDTVAHPAALINLFSLYLMAENGIRLVKAVV